MTNDGCSILELISSRINDFLREDENEDLSYIDLFFPKICTLIGSDGCMRIYNGENPVEVFISVGLTKEDYESLSSLIKEGMRIYNEDDSLETLFELDRRSDALLKGYLGKVRNFKIKRGVSEDEINKFDADINNFFDNSLAVFTPCVEHEKMIDKNNVK